jgi:hypothetical protein
MMTSAVTDQSSSIGSGSAATTPFGNCFNVTTRYASKRRRILAAKSTLKSSKACATIYDAAG